MFVSKLVGDHKKFIYIYIFFFFEFEGTHCRTGSNEREEAREADSNTRPDDTPPSPSQQI